MIFFGTNLVDTCISASRLSGYFATLLVMLLAGCDSTELSSAAAINAQPDAYMDGLVQLTGTHVQRNRDQFFISTGRLDYIVLEDPSARIRIWYDVAERRCAPRLGAALTVTGKVVAPGADARPIFVARSISADDEPPLADDEVRLCQLSLQEQQIQAEEGPEGLQEFWRSEGLPERTIVYD